MGRRYRFLVLEKARHRRQLKLLQEEKERKQSPRERLNWVRQVFGHAPLHHLSYFLDRFDFAALETASFTMQEHARKGIRARYRRLPLGQRMAHLQGAFNVGELLKELLRREGHHPRDMISTGGFTRDTGIVNTVTRLDLVTKRHTALAPMMTPRSDHATAVLDDKLFAMGGAANESHGYMSSVEYLDMSTGQWSEAAPMNQARGQHSAAVLGGKIYVAGGDPWQTVARSVECFDPATGQWSNVASMHTPRMDFCMVSTHGKLFAIGGYNFEGLELTNVECFDPSTGTWAEHSTLSTAREYVNVAVMGNKMYAIGGLDHDRQIMSSVECLDLSIPNSKWFPVAPMTARRCRMGVVVMDGKIYVASGASDSMECFDPNEGRDGRWTVVKENLGYEYPLRQSTGIFIDPAAGLFPSSSASSKSSPWSRVWAQSQLSELPLLRDSPRVLRLFIIWFWCLVSILSSWGSLVGRTSQSLTPGQGAMLVYLSLCWLPILALGCSATGHSITSVFDS